MESKAFSINATHKKKSEIYLGLLEDDFTIDTTWILDFDLTEDEMNTLKSRITAFCDRNNLTVVDTCKYHLKVSGTHLSLNSALKVKMLKYLDGDEAFHDAGTSISLPGNLKGVKNILGFNNRKIFKPHFHIRDVTERGVGVPYFTPLEVAQLYQFPQNLDGTGQKIGVIELGGGYAYSDITSYLNTLGITTPPTIHDVSVGGAVNSNDNSGASIEVVLDVEIITAIAPKATINVYFAPNSEQGFYNAINQAIIDGCKIISVSWGSTETHIPSSILTSFNDLLKSGTLKGVTTFVAAGDGGSSDGYTGNNVDFPSSSQYAISCGGTRLTTTSEVVWNNSTTSATGGGISSFFTQPVYQSSLSYPLNGKRGVPDVTGNADPQTGYAIFSTIAGGNLVIGGTSAVAPLWAGLLARLNQSVGNSTTFNHNLIYSNPHVFRDIVTGNNGGYSARIGWDPCSGLGSPDGGKLLNIMCGNLPPVTQFTTNVTTGSYPLVINFTDTSTNSPTSWSWNFGDGSTSTEQNPSHTYLTVGLFSVTLTATNAYGSNTTVKSNYINVKIPVPVVDFNVVGNKIGNVPFRVSFIDGSTGSPYTWLWTFGDGTTSAIKNPSHIYYNSGTYTVTLRATNSTGSNIITKTNLIQVLPKVPVVGFGTNIVMGTKPLTVKFTDYSANLPTSWLWDFGDGNTSTLKSPTNIYVSAGVYTVKLTATNSGGSAMLTKSNLIRVSDARPVANFMAPVTTGSAPFSVNFVDTSVGVVTGWSWNFGDYSYSNIQNPTHVYTRKGTFTVYLTVRNSGGTSYASKYGYVKVV